MNDLEISNELTRIFNLVAEVPDISEELMVEFHQVCCAIEQELTAREIQRMKENDPL
jgi:hypothetical protein